MKGPAAILLLLTLLLSDPLSAAGSGESSDFRELKSLFSMHKEQLLEKEAWSFLKKYPKSSRVPDVRLMMAEIESDPDLAVKKYRTVVRYYRYFPKRDYALYRLCQILDLKSRWSELLAETDQAIGMFRSGTYFYEFRFMNINSLIMLKKYSEAERRCLALTEKTHDFTTLCRSIYLLAEINRKKTGNSRSYIYSLRELAMGFQASELYPSIIYRLAGFYEQRGDIDRAYSAYTDLLSRFPDSPEADMAIMRMEALNGRNPRLVKYMPDNAMIEKTDRIDISPVIDKTDKKGPSYYSVSIGPMSSKTKALEIERLLKSYGNVRRMSLSFGYYIYIGRFTDTESALDTRIRLAEEFGINGNIVRVSENERRSYIYREQ